MRRTFEKSVHDDREKTGTSDLVWRVFQQGETGAHQKIARARTVHGSECIIQNTQTRRAVFILSYLKIVLLD